MWKKRVIWSGAVVGVLIACLVAGWWVGRVRAPQPSRFVRLAPFVAPETIQATTLGGTEVSFDLRTRTRPLLALVLSTSCKFCRANMEPWAELVDRVGASRSADTIVLSTSAAEDTAALLAAHGLELPVRLLTDLGAVLPGVPGVPATLLIRPRTRRVDGILGVLDGGALRTVEEWIGRD